MCSFLIIINEVETELSTTIHSLSTQYTRNGYIIDMRCYLYRFGIKTKRRRKTRRPSQSKVRIHISWFFTKKYVFPSF